MARGMSKYGFTVRGTVMIWTFNDPASTKLELDYGAFNSNQKQMAGIHGTKQKVIDSMAGKGLADSIAQARRVVDGLKRGGWGMIGVDIEALIEAIVSVTGLDADAVRAKVDSADEAKMQEWASNAKIAAIMAEIEAKRKTEQAAASKDEFKFEI